MVIKFGDIFYIYSNEMNVPIGKIIVKGNINLFYKKKIQKKKKIY